MSIRIRNIIFSLITFCGTLVTIFFILEGVLRLLGRTSDNFLRQDAVLGWRHERSRAGYSVTGEYKVKVHLNDQGLVAEKNYSLDKPKGVFRIAIIGDSVTEAFQVETNQNFSSLLEKELNTARPSRSVEVLNFGVTSYGTVKEEYVLEHQALAFKPDLVILGFFVGNDFSDNLQEVVNPEASFTRREKIMNVVKLWLRNHSTAFRWFLNQKARNRFLGQGAGDHGLTTYGSLSVFNQEHGDSLKEALEKTEIYLQNIQTKAEKEKIPLLVLILPSKEQIQPALRAPLDQKLNWNKPQWLLSEWLAQAKIPYLDLLPSWQSWATINPGASAFFPLDGHPNATGQRLIAEALKAYFDEHPSLIR